MNIELYVGVINITFEIHQPTLAFCNDIHACARATLSNQIKMYICIYNIMNNFSHPPILFFHTTHLNMIGHGHFHNLKVSIQYLQIKLQLSNVKCKM